MRPLNPSRLQLKCMPKADRERVMEVWAENSFKDLATDTVGSDCSDSDSATAYQVEIRLR